MKKDFPTEFVYQVFSLLIAVIVVHAIYVAVIRPDARAFMEQEAQAIQANRDYVPERSLAVVIKDYEQEACFILMLWAFAIIIYKAVVAYRQRLLLDKDLILLSEDMRILPLSIGGELFGGTSLADARLANQHDQSALA